MGSIKTRWFIGIFAVHGGTMLALHALLHSSDAETVLWPPLGISLALLLIAGPQHWPAVALGALAGYATDTSWTLTSRLGLALAAGVSTGLAAFAITRARVRLDLPAVRDTAWLALGGLFLGPVVFAAGSTMIVGIAGIAGIVGHANIGGFVNTWFTNALGALVFTPFVLAWRQPRERSGYRSAERTAFVGACIVVVAVLALTTVGFRGGFALLALSVVSLVLWSAERFGLRVTATLNVAIALATAIGYGAGSGLFGASRGNGPWTAQLFIAGVIVISLVFVTLTRDRNAILERLRASESRLTSVLNSSQDQIALLAVHDGGVQALEMGNRSLLNSLRVLVPNLHPEQLIGRSRDDVSQHLADSLQTLVPLREAVQRTIADGSATHSTHEISTPFGERVLEATTVPVRGPDGEVTHVLWQSRDVTARVEAEQSLRASEARWRSLIEATPQFIMLVDRDRRLLFINRVVAGFTREQVIGSLLDEFITSDDNCETVRRNIAAVFERGETVRYEVEAIGPGGKPAWYRSDAGPVWDQGGVVAAIVLASDITEQIHAEMQRRQLELQLYHAQKMESLGTLAGGIAHDFNNVLAGIMANAELLRHSVADDPEAADSIRDILAAGKRARDVVRQILAFSRQQPLERHAVKLSDIILEAMTLLRASLSSGIRLRTTVRAGQIRVFADESQLHQVIMNLATNAAQAIGDVDGEIEIDAQAVEVTRRDLAPGGARERLSIAAGHYARLSVRDTGCGMEKATLNRIFDPFFTTKPVGQGTGLGLAVVHGIVTSHNGGIMAESEPGAGTTITVFLPLYREPAAVPASLTEAIA